LPLHFCTLHAGDDTVHVFSLMSSIELLMHTNERKVLMGDAINWQFYRTLCLLRYDQLIQHIA